MTDAMIAVGLNRYEAAVYATLIENERMTAAQVAARSHVPRQRVYDILSDLCRKGLVTEKVGAKRRCFGAVDPAKALPTLLREIKRRQSLENEQLAQNVHDLVSRIRPTYVKSNPGDGAETRVNLISDPARLADRVATLADQSEERVTVVCDLDFPPPDAMPALSRAAERLSLQCLYSARSLVSGQLEESRTRLAAAGAEVRLSEETPPPCAIFDERAAVVATAGVLSETNGGTSFEVNLSPFAQLVQRGFDSYWSHAMPLEAVSGQPLQSRQVKPTAGDARDRLLMAFRLGHPDPVPASWIGGGIWTLHQTGHTFTGLIGHPDEMARTLVDTFERTGNPIVYVGSGYNIFQLAPFGAKIQFRVVGHLDLAEPLVRDANELERFDLAWLGREPAIQTVWEAARIVSREIGDRALVAVTAWGPFNLAAHILGIENMTRALYRDPGQVEKAIEFSARVVKKFYEPLLEEKATPLISIADTVAGDHMSRAHFERFVLPTLQELIGWVKSKDALVLLHICGALRDKLDVLAQTGADCVSLDSRVDLRRAKALFAGKMCVAGNVDPANVLDKLTVKEVEAASREALVAGAPGGGFVLMPGCDLPPTVTLDNVRALLRAADMWR